MGKKDGDECFGSTCCNRKRDRDFKLEEGKFLKGILFLQCNRLLIEVCGCPIPENVQGWVSEHLILLKMSLFVAGQG